MTIAQMVPVSGYGRILLCAMGGFIMTDINLLP
jgi:hypothetical protein